MSKMLDNCNCGLTGGCYKCVSNKQNSNWRPEYGGETKDEAIDRLTAENERLEVAVDALE